MAQDPIFLLLISFVTKAAKDDPSKNKSVVEAADQQIFHIYFNQDDKEGKYIRLSIYYLGEGGRAFIHLLSTLLLSTWTRGGYV